MLSLFKPSYGMGGHKKAQNDESHLNTSDLGGFLLAV
nr:MAG TPA: hypothetical protein [Caudoviricetes sp.]